MHREFSGWSLADLVADLATGGVERRRGIAWELGQRGREGDRRVIPILIGLFGDNGSYVDEAASDQLWAVGEVVVGPLVAVLHDGKASEAARMWALRTLTYIPGSHSVDAMLTVLVDEGDDLELRRVVAMDMGRMRDPRAVEPLLGIAVDNKADPELRANAMSSLGELKDWRAVEALLGVLDRPDIRFITRDMERTIAQSREWARGTSGEAAVEAELAKREAEGASLHDAVLRALRDLRDPHILDVLLPMLGTEEDSLRGSVAAAAGSLGEVSLKPLVERLSASEWRVREAAARALGFGEQPTAVGPLIETLRTDPEAAVRSAAVESLGFIRTEGGIPGLREALRDEAMRVRQAALHSLWNYALVGLVGTELLPTLQDLAENDPWTIHGQYPVRHAAARVIKEIGQKGNSPDV